jgi:hypothetical protein
LIVADPVGLVGRFPFGDQTGHWRQHHPATLKLQLEGGVGIEGSERRLYLLSGRVDLSAPVDKRRRSGQDLGRLGSSLFTIRLSSLARA